MSEKLVLRPVTLSPEQAALFYVLLLQVGRVGVVPGERLKDAGDSLRSIEAAMEPLPAVPATDEVNSVLAQLETPHNDEWTDGRTHRLDVGGELTGDD